MREGPVSQDSAYIPAPDMIAQKIVEELQAALAQLKLARCPHSLTASLAALPSMSLIPFTPFTEIANDLKTN
jgi:uncharacterized protein (DUF2062 family)